MLKLMRPAQAFTYVIDRLPEVPAVLDYLVQQAGMEPATAYSTFNMGCGFAVYCAAGSGDDVVRIAEGLGHRAHVAGRVKAGPRRVLLSEVDVTYESADMDLTPQRAA
jgi:phosphoribosylformylglycinamidine cyclo-ligase